MKENLERIRTKNKRRRIRKNTFYIFITLVIILLFLVIGYENFFDIKKIDVKCESELYVSKDDIIESSGISIGDNLLSIDKSKAEKALITEYPYFERVEFEKVLPSELTIIPVLQSGPMYIKVGGDYFIISDTCRVLEMVDDPMYDGVHRTEVKTSGIEKCICGENIVFDEKDSEELIASIWAAVVAKNVTDKITSIDISDKFNMTLNYENRLTAILGNYEHMEYKVAFFVKVVQDEISQYDKGIIDVTDTSGAIARLS